MYDQMDIGEESQKIMSKARWYNRWLYSFVKPYLGKKILELGSGIGNFTELLVDDRRLVDASDIENKYLKKLRARFKGINKWETGNVGNFNKVNDIVARNKIEIIFHLAAQALVEKGAENPAKTFKVNVEGAWNVKE